MKQCVICRRCCVALYCAGPDDAICQDCFFGVILWVEAVEGLHRDVEEFLRGAES